MRSALLPAALCLALAAPAAAQERPNTILVMDGSGSMWGQIEGVAKITIAQEVVAGLLADFPADQGLGLTVYGHRERGECTDIETVVAPAPGTAAEIVAAVNGIKPLGKTPMTDAVIAAAEALRYTEDKATVILVSDGVETCNPDPCAAARLLEEAGIDFTAHVIGFDVGSDAAALAQMQCIADETGGQFLTADTADQLTEALTQVAAAAPAPEPEPEPEPEPVLVPTALSAVIEGTGEPVPGPVLWDVEAAGTLAADDAEGNPLALDLPEGSYVATAYSVALETALSRQFVAIGTGVAVEIAFPAPVAAARVIAPAEAVAGSTIEVGWDGPAGEGDYIGIGAADADGSSQWRNWAAVADGNPVALLVPPEPGPHVIRYFTGEGRQELGAAEIAVTPVSATLEAPAEAPAGAEIAVAWTGPAYAGDYIGIGRAGADGAARWENWVEVGAGSPAPLIVPAEPGAYEITYFLGQDRTPVTTVALTAAEISARLVAPAEAPAGATIEVGWTGPDYEGDYIGIGRADADGAARWETWTATEAGNPLEIVVPATPGAYTITYFTRQDRTPLAEVALTVTAQAARVVAPAEAVAGATIEVGWEGPGFEGDYIGIGKAGASGASRWETWTATESGNPVEIAVPTEPGAYTVTYFMRQDRTPLAEAPLTVAAVAASVSAPAEAVGGSTIDVAWTGPDYDGDYIGIGPAGADGAQRWQNWVETDAGTPARLLVPPQAGDYTITYFVRQDRTPMAETTLRVTAPAARLVAPQTADAGATIEIGGEGPAYEGDYIGIGAANATGAARWQNWVETSGGGTAELLVPPLPGDYVITYFVRQDRTPIAEVPIRVGPLDVRLEAPASAAAGSEIEVTWAGPDYDGDYIGIGRAGTTGSAQWQEWAATARGNPATLRVPDTPGDYVIRYFLRQDRTVAAEFPLAVE